MSDLIPEYIKTQWSDLPSKASPINSTALNNIETGVENLNTFVNDTLQQIISTIVRTINDLGIDSLKNVIITNPQNNDGIKYDAEHEIWVNGSAASSVATLTDVQLTNLKTGDGLVYDSNSGKWKNGATGQSLDYFDTAEYLNGALPWNKQSSLYKSEQGMVLDNFVEKLANGDCYCAWYQKSSNEVSEIFVSPNPSAIVYKIGSTQYNPSQSDYVTFKNVSGQDLKWYYVGGNLITSATSKTTSLIVNYAGEYISSPVNAAQAVLNKVYYIE